MADLKGRNRGQILLIGALALAFTFVALSLVINSAIFTENLASRGDTTDGENVVEFRDTLRRGTGALLAFENQNVSAGEGRGLIQDRLERGLHDMESMVTRKWARRGATSNVSVANTTNGSRLFQAEHRAFTNGNDNGTWEVAGDIDQTRAFRLNVSRANTSEEGTCGLFEGCFVLQLDNGSSTWNLSIATDTSNDVVVAVDDGSGEERCDPVDQAFVEVDVTAGTVAGEHCPALSFGDAPASGYDIDYYNGTEIEGTYTLVVDNPSLADSPPVDYPSDSPPSVAPALYDVVLGYEYRAAYAVMESQVRVAPGEADA